MGALLVNTAAGDFSNRDKPWRGEPIYKLHAEVHKLSREQAASPAAISSWCQRAHDHLTKISAEAECIALWRELLLPYFVRSPFLKRCREKPRGYAGDYVTIQMMYENLPSGGSTFGKAVDAWAMGQPCPKAVRNRRALVGSFVNRVSGVSRGHPLSIVSLGCGPAAEVFDVLHLNDIRFTLIDFDEDATSYVRAQASSRGVDDRLHLMHANVIKMMFRDQGELPANQSAFYSLGLIDYFKDNLVIRLLDYIYDKLALGGLVLLGNFRPGHANEALFQHALDWPLVLRSENELRHLVRQSKFSNSPIVVGTEKEGVQLFIECVKT